MADNSRESIREEVDRFADMLPAEIAPQTAWREGLALYLARLAAYGRVFNLVGTRGVGQILDNLVLDSFYLAAFLNRLPLPENPLALDCGAGAGLPGIPLRLLWQAGSYTLVEQRKKRALFLENVLAELALPRTTVFAGDAFRLSGPADLIVSRAWLPVDRALQYCAPRLAPGGFAILFTLGAEPPPPASFELFDGLEYLARGDLRKIWAVRRGCGV